jgi:membrane associated rhomboid family serine protease
MSDFRYTRPSGFPPIIKNLIIINVLVWVAQLMFASYNLTERIGLWPIESPHFNPYQIATHMFAHAAYDENGGIVFSHILFNMFALWMFGRILENVWGAKRFLLFYLACGIGSALAHMTVQYFQYKEIIEAVNIYNSMGKPEMAAALQDLPVYVVGASGAVMGVMVGFAFLFPNTELYIMFIPIPIKAKWVIAGFVALDLFGGLNPSRGDNIAHFAHLGGALTGFIIVYIWNKTNRKTLY